MLARALKLLPEGRMLPETVWRRRHRAVVRIALVQAVILGIISYVWGSQPGHALCETIAVSAPALLAIPERLGRKLRSAAATASLMGASVLLIHLWSGVTEAHFHFFVMVGLVSLYQDWVPFGVSLVSVIGHHGIFGTLFPHHVFGTPAAQHNPWLWAGIHGGFVLAASCAHLAAWRLNEQQGLRDPLTGLANRTLLEETINRALFLGGPVSVLFLDLDDFKDVNDSRGHTVGDELLHAVALRLQGCVRSSDTVARLGGDEFAAVVAAPPQAGREIGQRMIDAMSEPLVIDGRPVIVGASVGIADTTTATDRSVSALLRNADLAMYLAKAQGKRRLVIYADGVGETVRRKATLQDDLRTALENNQLEVRYQPLVNLEDSHTTGFEALLRWHHPVMGDITPVEFIPLAEETGLIVTIGRWVIGQSVAQAATWSAQVGRPLGIAVNLSPLQLLDPDLVACVRDALAEHGMPGHQLTLEITESVLVHEIDRVVETLEALRALGARIAIDDFGTGFSSLSYLRQLPTDVIKIDRSFVQDLANGSSATTLVASVIELARTLGLEVVAEGIETQTQRLILQELHCSLGQGFLFSHARPASEHTDEMCAGLVSAGPLPLDEIMVSAPAGREPVPAIQN